jgi:hypothetical protein
MKPFHYDQAWKIKPACVGQAQTIPKLQEGPPHSRAKTRKVKCFALSSSFGKTLSWKLSFKEHHDETDLVRNFFYYNRVLFVQDLLFVNGITEGAIRRY